MATLSQFPKLIFSPLPPRLTIPRCQNSIFASLNKPRSRQVKSNADLCNDLKEFLSVAGLPQDHVPTTKELTQFGRKDLANIVRRRGYKVIREILGISEKPIDREPNSEGGFGEDSPSISPGQDEKMKSSVDDDESSFSKASVIDGVLNSVKDGEELNSHKQNYVAEESSVFSSLQKKAANFIQNGELDNIEDNDFDFLNKTNSNDVDGRENADDRSSTYKEQKELAISDFNGSEVSNGMILSSTQQLDDAGQDFSPLKRYSPAEEAKCVEDKGVHVKTEKADENQAEINRLKIMMHQKEMELAHLKQQIEEEKRALSALQTKAETEISKAMKLISEKDAELNAAEESLSGLKEVEIQYRGDGENVEVAGSFNGWHQKIKMDPQASASTIDPTGVRKSRLWRTVLWLYPGIYEIKFVVDGHWRIDPERELVTRGAIENNVLRVER